MTCLMPFANVHDPADALDVSCPLGVAAATVAPIAASVIVAAARAIASPFLLISIPPLRFDARNLRHRHTAGGSNGFRYGYTAETAQGRTKPIRSYIRSSIGSDTERALSAPLASMRRSSSSSARSSS